MIYDTRSASLQKCFEYGSLSQKNSVPFWVLIVQVKVNFMTKRKFGGNLEEIFLFTLNVSSRAPPLLIITTTVVIDTSAKIVVCASTRSSKLNRGTDDQQVQEL